MAEGRRTVADGRRTTRVGRYELGKTIGEGSFAKVKIARDTRNGTTCAIKVLDRNHVLRHKMVEQIKREIATMKLIRHPNVVQLHEVMASKSKIYMVLDFVDGGELFDKIVSEDVKGELQISVFCTNCRPSSGGGGNHMDSMESCVPPGFRFHPTDEELVGYYLRKKVASQKIDLDVIRDIDLYRIEPWDLTEHCGIGYEEQNDWYFFSFKDRKYPTGTRTNRATMAGFWKATGRDKAVHERSRLIGMRKTLVFYKGRAPNGQKTDWIMHEYRLETDENAPPQEEGWVVCRAFKKRTAYPNRGMVERWDANYSYHEANAMGGGAAAFANPNVAAQMGRSAHFKEEAEQIDGAAALLRYTANHLVELPQLESPSAPLPRRKASVELEEDAVDAGRRRRPGKNARVDNAATADWRALDKFVASQLSPAECGALEANAAASSTAAAAAAACASSQAQLDQHDEDDMAALLFLNSDGRDEMERWTGLLGSAGTGSGVDGDLGICVFDK